MTYFNYVYIFWIFNFNIVLLLTLPTQTYIALTNLFLFMFVAHSTRSCIYYKHIAFKSQVRHFTSRPCNIIIIRFYLV